MQRLSIREILNLDTPCDVSEIQGWVRTHRQSKNISFIELTDGSGIKGLQLVLEPGTAGYAGNEHDISTGASIRAWGELVASPARGQTFEFRVNRMEILGRCDSEAYPLQKKGHSLEFLREILHLRPRSNTIGASYRLRSTAAMGIHTFFQSRGYFYVHTPIITTSDCEGAGAMFHVTTLDLGNLPIRDGKIDYSQDFFKEPASLTVSGQLEAEVGAQALSRVYTFGPTFRAENSNTVRHLSEFWMIEPETAFCELEGNMELAESFIRFLIKYVLENCAEEMEFFASREWMEKDHLDMLHKVAESNFARMDYTDAIKELQKSGKEFEFPVSWGMDLQAEHERYITDVIMKGPVFVLNYPKEIKAFYMRVNEDGRTVRAMDCLVPRLGEIIGGSQREERYDVLLNRIREMGLPEEAYWWYLELRRYGTAPHAGFGLGFERFLMYVSGIQNIRDVTPFPRYPGYARF